MIILPIKAAGVILFCNQQTLQPVSDPAMHPSGLLARESVIVQIIACIGRIAHEIVHVGPCPGVSLAVIA